MQDARILELEQQVAKLAAVVTDLARTSSDDSDIFDDVEATPEELQAEQTERAEEAENERLALIDELELQAIDPEWSAATKSVIQSSVDAGLRVPEFEGVSVGDVECWSTACRVDVSVDDPRRIGQVLTLLPFDAEAIFQPDEDDEGSGSFYVVPGTQAPSEGARDAARG